MKHIGMFDDPNDFMTERQFRDHCWQVARANLFGIFDEFSGSDWLPWAFTRGELERLRDEVGAAVNRVLWDGAVEKSDPKMRARLTDPEFERFLDAALRKPAKPK